MLGDGYHETFWPVLASPLIVAFVLAMGIFIGKGLPSTRSGRQVRGLLVLGLTAWVLAIVYEVSGEFAFGDYRAKSRLLEETLEFGGSLVIGLGAAIALRAPAIPRPALQVHGRGSSECRPQFPRPRPGWTRRVVAGGRRHCCRHRRYQYCHPAFSRGAPRRRASLFQHWGLSSEPL